jgi:hypothetical protein
MYRHIDSDQVIVRAAHPSDATDLRRLAALDSGTPPAGAALVAESDARILAALPLGSGRPIADPFEPTAELVALLELRREQLRRGERKERRSVAGRLRGLFGAAALTGRRA